MVLCLSATNGQILWRRDYPSDPYRHHQDNSFAASSPAVDSHGVYVTWTTPKQGTLLGLDHTGTQQWLREWDMFDAKFGSGVSPVCYEKLVILANDHRADSFVVAVNSRTGKTQWLLKQTPGKTPYATPCILELDGKEPEIITVSTANGVSAIKARTGELSWTLGGIAGNPARERPVCSPIVADGKILGVYGTAGRGTTSFVIRPGNTAKGTKPRLVRSLNGRLPYVPTPLVKDNLLFIWNDNGTVICYRLPDYEQLWEAEVPGNFYGSPVCINDRLYCLSKKGVVVVIAAAETYQLHAENPLGELSFATPAISGGRMYLRTHTQLISVGGKDEEKAP